ncbi:MAG: hypothetical protein JKY49_04830 [Cohaesibacteraceae bacterium]|nr:hypothetical protein [Cohaesibacteraceae bacterium]MBL4876116.1 hypothetical protein [Cohaesibacteraceae bacterium]
MTVVGTANLVTDARNQVIQDFQPDKIQLRSFYWSMTHAPVELQDQLHAMALKNCEPFGWSYRDMEFYAIPLNAAVNVLPAQWIKDCKIERISN